MDEEIVSLFSGSLDAYTQALMPQVMPFFQRHQIFLFQQDNARPHNARATEDFLRQNNTNLLPYPARSQVLNPYQALLGHLRETA